MRRLVLGQAPITVNDTVASLCRWRRIWLPPLGIDLRGWLIEGLIKLLRIEVNAWDRFSIRQRHFVHQPISPPERFGLVSLAPTLEAVLETAGVPHRGRLGRAEGPEPARTRAAAAVPRRLLPANVANLSAARHPAPRHCLI